MSARNVKIEILSQARTGGFTATDAAAGKTQGILGRLTGGIGKVGSAFGGMAKLAGGFVLAQGILRAPGALLGMAQAAAEDAASVGRLQQAVENTGQSWGSYSDGLADVVKAGQDLGFSDDDIRNGLTVLTNETGNASEAMDRLKVAQDFARGAGIDLGTASKLLGKITDENVGVLKRYGIEVDENATAQDLLNKVDQKFGGQAAKFAASDAGKVARLRDRWGELQETIGYKVLPILSALTSFALDKLLPGLESVAAFVSNKFGPAFTAIAGYLRAVVDDGDLLNDWLSHLPGWLQAPLKLLGNLVSTLLNVAKTLRTGNWSGAAKALVDGLKTHLSLLKDIGGDILRWLIDAVKGVDYGGMAQAIVDGIVSGWDTVTDFGSRFASWAKGQFDNIRWGDVAGAIIDGVVAGWDAVTDFGSRFASWAKSQFDAISWSGLAGGMLDGIDAGWDAVTDWGTRFYDWAKAQFDAVDWTGLATDILDGIVNGFFTVVDWATRFYDWAAGQFQAVDWGGLATSILDGIVTGWNTVTDWATRFYGWAKTQFDAIQWTEVATGILDKIVDGWNTVTDFGTRFIDWLKGQMTGQADAAKAAGVELGHQVGQGVVQGIDESAPKEGGESRWSKYFTDITMGIDSIKTHFETMVGGVTTAGEGLNTFLGTLGLSFQNLKLVGEGAGIGLAGALEFSFGAILSAVGHLEGDIGHAGEAIGFTFTTLAGVVQFSKDAMSTAWNDFVSDYNHVKDAITATGTAIGIAFGFTRDTLVTILGALQTAWGVTWDAIKGKADAVWDVVSGIPGTAARGAGYLKSAIMDPMDTLSGLWDGAWSGLSGTVDTWAGDIAGKIGPITDAVNGLISAIQTLIGWIASIPDHIELPSLPGGIPNPFSLGQSAQLPPKPPADFGPPERVGERPGRVGERPPRVGEPPTPGPGEPGGPPGPTPPPPTGGWNNPGVVQDPAALAQKQKEYEAQLFWDALHNQSSGGGAFQGNSAFKNKLYKGGLTLPGQVQASGGAGGGGGDGSLRALYDAIVSAVSDGIERGLAQAAGGVI